MVSGRRRRSGVRATGRIAVLVVGTVAGMLAGSVSTLASPLLAHATSTGAASGSATGAATVTAHEATLAPSRYVALSPTRVLDQSGVGTTPVRVSVVDEVPADATAVVLNVTGDRPSAATDVSAYPGDLTSPPVVSSLNLLPGTTSADLSTVPLPADAARTVLLHNHSGTIRLVVDVEGYYVADGSGSPFVPVRPYRAYDSRLVAGGKTPLTAAGRVFTAAALRVPATASAVVLNLTAVAPSAPTVLTVWPAGRAEPLASDLNVAAGDNRANLVTVGLGAAGSGIEVTNAHGSAQIVLDIEGWYSPTATGALYTPLAAPTRIFGDPTRPALGPGVSFDLSLPVPAAATAVAMTVTATAAAGATDETAYPPAGTPVTSNVNVDAHTTTPNFVLTSIGSSSAAVPVNAPVLTGSVSTPTAVRLRNHASTVELVIDLAGYLVPQSPGEDVSFNQCAGSATTTPLPAGASFGIVNPTAGGLASTSAASCLGSLEGWATATGSEQFYLPLVDFGQPSPTWRAPAADAPDAVACTAGVSSASAGCAYDYGWTQAEYAVIAAGPDGGTAPWWVDVEPGTALWSVCSARGSASPGCTAQPATQNAEVTAGALAYLHGHAAGIYSSASAWSALIGAAAVPGAPAFSLYPEWYSTGGLTTDQLVTACATPFAGGRVAVVQSIAPAAGEADASLDADLLC